MGVILEAVKVSKHFGGLRAVDAVDLAVTAGQIHGIIGPNGAGKTTLFNCLTGYLPVSQGDIRLAGRSILGLGPERIVPLGMVRTFQNIRLFKSLSVLDNVKVGLHSRTQSSILDAILRTSAYRREEGLAVREAQEALERVGLAEFAASPAGSLPYGRQRILEIARALAAQPRVLLLDEPAAGLNPVETNQLIALIEKLNYQGLTIVLIEHDMRLIMSICDQITVLNHGKRICTGSPQKVQNDAEVIAAYLGSGRGGLGKKAEYAKS